MDIEASEISGEEQKREDQTRECPECGNEMTMTQVVRVEAPSGMYWVCDNYSCGTAVNKAGSIVGQLELS